MAEQQNGRMGEPNTNQLMLTLRFDSWRMLTMLPSYLCLLTEDAIRRQGFKVYAGAGAWFIFWMMGASMLLWKLGFAMSWVVVSVSAVIGVMMPLCIYVVLTCGYELVRTCRAICQGRVTECTLSDSGVSVKVRSRSRSRVLSFCWSDIASVVETRRIVFIEFPSEGGRWGIHKYGLSGEERRILDKIVSTVEASSVTATSRPRGESSVGSTHSATHGMGTGCE